MKKLIILTFALISAAVANISPAQAALWSAANVLLPVGGSSAMMISVTGDQFTTEAVAVLTFPPSFSITALQPTNNSSCTLSVLPNGWSTVSTARGDGVQVIRPVNIGTCRVFFKANPGASSQWINMSTQCLDATGAPTVCFTDRAFIEVI